MMKLRTEQAAAVCAYPIIALNSADYGIGTVYMAESLLTPETINPVTVAPYTESELDQVKHSTAIMLDEGMALAISVCNADTVFEYTAEESAAIRAHSDPLKLDAGSGAVSTLNGDGVVMV